MPGSGTSCQSLPGLLTLITGDGKHDRRAESTLDMHGGGARTRDVLFVADTARGMVDASMETAVGHAVDPVSGRETGIRELAAVVDDGARRVRQSPHPHPRRKWSGTLETRRTLVSC